LKAVREKLTFSNVVAVIALFIALGGTAMALEANSVGPRQLKKNAVVTAKIRNGAVTTSKIAGNAVTTAKIRSQAVTGPKIKLSTLGTVPRAAVATTGAPLAYARVEFTGTVNVQFAKNIAQANVSHPVPGVYCFNLPFLVSTGQVVAESDAEPDDIAAIEIVGANGGTSLSGCPAGDDVEVRTFDTETAAGPQDSDFYIELNG
jgi:hypothetical protein